MHPYGRGKEHHDVSDRSIHGGVTLVIIPLLSLTANQMERIKKAPQKDGIVAAIHLDDAAQHDVKENVIPEMDTFPYNSSTTFMILCSPQFIAFFQHHGQN